MFGTLRPDCEPIKPIVKWAGGGNGATERFRRILSQTIRHIL